MNTPEPYSALPRVVVEPLRKPTPGPWKTERVSRLYGCYGHEITRNSGSVEDRTVVLATIATDSFEDRANAKLIAALPDILSALQCLAEECQASRKYIVLSDDGGFDAYNATADALNRAHKAIASAT